MAFPMQRMRRTRETEPLRRMVRETTLSPSDFIYPVFVTEGQGRREPINSMPGQCRVSIDLLIKEALEVKSLGIPAVILFGIPDRKDERGSSGFDPNGIVQRAIRALKEQVPELVVITDVCIDEYTSHGHCGIVRNGKIVNDETLDCLRAMAKTHAEAGADMVAPSDMMDGRVAAIRDELDPANKREALREIDLDVEEGADIIMVKPAMPYLDVISAARERTLLPIAAYQVSGEYSMIKAAAQAGWLDERRAMMESLLSIKRAGAEIILTYFAKEAAALLQSRHA